MTGTASEFCDESETGSLNNFDLLSLMLFDKLKADRLRCSESCDRVPILYATSPLTLSGDSNESIEPEKLNLHQI